MQDRVSLYPGRVKLEPVAGQANLYDLTRADQPTQEGTPLNKASLLTDGVCEILGLAYPECNAFRPFNGCRESSCDRNRWCRLWLCHHLARDRNRGHFRIPRPDRYGKRDRHADGGRGQ